MTDFTDTPPPDLAPNWATRWRQLLDRHHWLPFVLPLAVFMLLGILEPKRPAESAQPNASGFQAAQSSDREAATAPPDSGPKLSYPLAYGLRIAATCVAILLVWPVWREVPRPISWLWAIGTGAVGAALWIGICHLGAEDRLLHTMGLGAWATLGDRAAFNPYAALGGTPVLMVAFLAVRLLGLTVIVPLIEEFFLRGFLMRFIQDAQWWKIELGEVSWLAAVTATAYGVLAHPAEPLAALVWFSMITLLYARTRRIWDCIVAHAVTNAMLGAYVLAFRDWTLW